MFRTINLYIRIRRKKFRTMQFYLVRVGFRGLFRAIRAIATNSMTTFRASRKDIKFPFYMRIPSSDVANYKQIFIDQEYDFVVETPPKTIVDAGANIGLATIYFANRYPEAKIIAIEPEKSNFELLKKNVEPYSNVYPVNAALWNKNEEINVVDHGRGKWAFMTEGKNSSESLPGDIRHTIRAITIDRIIDDFELDKIDILKIDIEGAEKEVFDDTSSWIGKVDALIVELHERIKSGCNRSFYNGSNGFDNEWEQGENVFLTRATCLTRRPT